jgi:hypothetical protein
MPSSSFLDEYALKARLWPALLAGLPVGALVGALFPNAEWWHAVIAGSGASVGLMFLLAQMARSAGKLKEPRLHARWAGKPTTLRLRHRDTAFDQHTLARYHRNVEQLAAELRMPTPDEEAADPSSADERYEAATRLLIARTRDTKRFRLLFRENIHYGFCRNIWGLKPVAVTIAVVTALITGSIVSWDLRHGRDVRPAIVAVGIFSIAWAMVWLFWFTADWVRVAADGYADRLLEASDDLLSAEKRQAGPATE